MAKVALLATLEAKPGREEEVDRFLRDARETVRQEPGTVSWYAFRLGDRKFGIFETFEDEAARKAHVSGRVGATIFERSPDWFAEAAEVLEADLLAERLP